MEEIYESLLALQALDVEIARAAARVESFTPEFERLDEPVRALAREVESLRTQLQELRDSARRLERGAAEKRELLKRYEDRLQRVRTAREEAAARTEIDLIQRAAEADEKEALELQDQALRAELKLDELEKKLDEARAALEPRRHELESARAAAADELVILRDRRQNHAIRINPAALRLYERIRGNNGRTAITALTPDGACSSCFGVIPLQKQVEIRQGPELVRCEFCGVILYPGS